MKKLVALLLIAVMALSVTAFADPEFNWSGSGVVSVYSGMPADSTEELMAAFTAKTGIQTEVVYGGGGELLARIAAEGENPMADVIFGVSQDITSRYKDYFTTHKLESVDPANLGVTELVDEMFTPGVARACMVIMVNTDLLPEEDWPTTWADLTNEKYRGKIAFVDPTASSSGYIQLSGMMQLYGWDFIEEFYRNLDGKLQSSSGAVPRLCADGEYAIALTYEAGTTDYVAAGAPVKVIYPEDGVMPIQSPPALIKNGPNPENGIIFYEWLFSTDYSEICAKYGFVPVRTDVAQPEGVPARTEIKFMDYDYDISADSATMLEHWNEIVENN